MTEESSSRTDDAIFVVNTIRALYRSFPCIPELVNTKLNEFVLSVASTSEGGLLGMALHPDFNNNHYFYVYVTVEKENNTINQVEQWRLSEDRISAERIKVIFDKIEAARYHDGGRIAFGPDGMLYAGTGDARDPDTSQDPDSPNGKLLRLTLDGDKILHIGK